jgi:hypothetical protein
MFWLGIILMCGAAIFIYFIVKEDWQPILWIVIGCFLAGTIICSEAAKEAHPQAIDVYRGKTTLEITYRDSVAIDSTVVYKVK